MQIHFGLLKMFVNQIQKDFNGDFGIDDTDDVEISTDGHDIVFQGSFDCPPIYFKYVYGPSTDWKLINQSPKRK